jgi:sugar lactone lactonase YvrE
MRNNVEATGAPAKEGGRDGILYRVDGAGRAVEFRRDLAISNTLLWSPDRSRFYFGDSIQNCIWSYDYNIGNRSIAGERPFFQGFERGLPDGSTIDKDGFVWNCRYGGSCIVRVAPSGEVDRVIEMPVSNLTNCTFGGEQGNVLYATSASPEAGKWERFGGGLFAIETNTAGLTETEFRI